MNKEITNILAPVAGVGAVGAGAGFVHCGHDGIRVGSEH